MRYLSMGMVLLLFGCAGLRVVDVSNDSDDAKAFGVRYYMPSPYLLVKAAEDGSITTEVIQLPDPHKKFSAQPYNTLATNNTTLEFDKGVIKYGESEVDSSAVPKAVLSALEKVAIAYLGAANRGVAEATAPTIPLPQIFKIVSDKDGVYLIGPNGRIPGPAVEVAVRANEVK